MEWWSWVIFLIAAVGLLTAATLAVQARRRSGTVIAVRTGNRPSREGPQ
ncbi:MULTISPECIES: hypothetical protein [Streptomyces]|nr:hypothetical protein [Streptomyces durhamensis]